MPLIINYPKAKFKGGAQTWCIKQDKNGILYFANNDGLLSFDGTYWKLYPLPNKTIVRSIAIADDGKIYVGGQNEIGFFYPNKNGVLTYTSLLQLLPQSAFPIADVWNIEIQKGTVFVRTVNHIFEIKDNLINDFFPSSEWLYMQIVGDRLFAQDKSRGLLEYYQKAWHSAIKTQVKQTIQITSMVALGGDSILVGTLRHGLYFLINMVLYKRKSILDSLFSKTIISGIFKFNNNEIVVGTNSLGCIIINSNGQILQKFSQLDGLQNNDVLSLFVDRDGHMWTGLNNGISFIAYNDPIKYIKPNPSNELSGYSAIVFNQKLYLATSNGVYVSVMLEQNKDIGFMKGKFVEIPNTSGQVWRLMQMGSQLIMNHNDGAFVINPSGVLPLLRETGAWLFLPITKNTFLQEMLIGTYAGLHRISFKDKHFNISNKLYGISESFRFLALDNDSNIWASHPYRGVYKITISKDKKSFNYKLFTQQHGLPFTTENYVFRILNKIVFATENGLYEFDETTQRFHPSPTLYGIFGNQEIQYLNEDEQHNIWFATKKKIGVAKYQQYSSNYNIVWFTELDDKVLTKFQNIYPYNKHNVFIGAENGFMHIDFEKYLLKQKKISVLLIEAKAVDKYDSVLFGGYAEGYGDKTNIKFNQALSNDMTSYRFQFSSPRYEYQHTIEYSYQMVGLEKNWSAWSNKTEKNYTNLTNTNYVFKVRARDHFGNESVPVLFSFSIKAPWYKTWWFFCLTIFLFLTLLYLISKQIKKRFALQKAKFEQEQEQIKYIHHLEVEKHEKNILELQNEKLANEVHFKNKELAKQTMHLIEKEDVLVKINTEIQKQNKLSKNNNGINFILEQINNTKKNDEHWEQFASHFDEINNAFLAKLKTNYPKLSLTDLKLCAYLKLHFSSKEIAQLLNISVRGVEISRYRLRQKLNIPNGINFSDFFA